LAVLPLLLSIRAAVRCHVSGQMGNRDLAVRYLDAALSHLEPVSPSLAAVGGLSGSGKSRRARVIAPGLGAAPGAVVLRTDEIRKRLWGAGALDRLPQEAYAPGFGERVYGEMLRAARLCLAAGRAVVLDAVFLKPEERDAAERLASEMGVPFEGEWLTVSPDLLRRRVAARRGDASDADLEVLERQLQADPGPLRWRTVRTD
jgi:predicted kinase